MFDRSKLNIKPLAARHHKLEIEKIAVTPDSHRGVLPGKVDQQILALAERIKSARKAFKPVILTYGAHLIKNGLAPVVNKLIEDGWITHIATNGAGSIHDWEFAYLGKSTEDVRANTAVGEFGTWEETGKYINLAVAAGGIKGEGYGASIGNLILKDGIELPPVEYIKERIIELSSQQCVGEELGALSDLLYVMTAFGLNESIVVKHPYKQFSVQYTASKYNIPFTIHPGIGYDIIYTHPMNCGGAIGRGSVWDFLIYAESISKLSGGVHITVGSAIMAPMIFEKALSMSNNVALQKNGVPLSDYYLAVVDIQDGGDWDWSQGEPPMENPAYYLRFCKTFYRMGGTLDYICLDNRQFMLRLCEILSK